MPISAGTDPLGPVQAAVYGVLSADSTLATLAPGGVMARVPQAPSYPYVRIETPLDEENGTMGKQGSDVLLWVHAFSSYDSTEGDRAALLVINRIKALLRYVTLTVAGYAFIACRFDRTRQSADEAIEGTPIAHFIAEFTVMVREA